MIAKVAYDVHAKPNTLTRPVSNAFKVPFVVNDKRRAGDSYYIPNADNYCNGVRTSPGWNIYPFNGNCEIRTHEGDVWDNNQSSLKNGYGSYIFSDGEVTFDFFDPSTDTFFPWTIYTQDIDLPYGERTVQGMALRWKDANGNHPPSITGVNDYIITAPNRYRNGNWYDGIIVMFGFDGFAYNPFSQTDPIVARLCIEVSRYDQIAGNIMTYPKLTGSNQRSNVSGSITSTKVRCMPYQFEYNTILYPDSKGYNINDPVTAKAIAFGMTNWVKLHDDFKQYIIANHYTEQVAEFEYTKYLEFSNL